MSELFSCLKHSCWFVLLATQVVSYGSYTILVHLCEENGQITFNSTAMNFLIEAFKLSISALFLLLANASRWLKSRRRRYQRLLIHHDSEAAATAASAGYNAKSSRNTTDNESDEDEDDDEASGEDSNDSHMGGSNKQVRSKQQQKLFRRQHKETSASECSPLSRHLKCSLNFSIPAFLYVINNNLAVYIQIYMDSTSYQMLSNMKIFTTALLYYLIIGKSLSRVKCLALFLLFLAGVFYSLANMKSLASYYVDEADLKELIKPDNVENSDYHARFNAERQGKSQPNAKFRLRDQIYITEIGFLLMLIYCLISGFSGVYNEYLFKLNFSDSIYLQNIYLYSYGCAFNLIAYHVESSYIKSPVQVSLTLTPEPPEPVQATPTALTALSNSLPPWYVLFFSGFSVYTWLIIFTQVFNGFLMSIVMKHSSNITRLFVISSSLVVTTVLSVLVFSLQLNAYFYIVFCAIMIALYLYTFK